MSDRLLCSECAKAPAIAKGLCRKCYERQRVIPRIAISKRIQPQVQELMDKMGWELAQTCNILMEKGLKYMEKREKIKEEWDL